MKMTKEIFKFGMRMAYDAVLSTFNVQTKQKHADKYYCWVQVNKPKFPEVQGFQTLIT